MSDFRLPPSADSHSGRAPLRVFENNYDPDSLVGLLHIAIGRYIAPFSMLEDQRASDFLETVERLSVFEIDADVTTAGVKEAEEELYHDAVHTVVGAAERKLKRTRRVVISDESTQTGLFEVPTDEGSRKEFIELFETFRALPPQPLYREFDLELLCENYLCADISEDVLSIEKQLLAIMHDPDIISIQGDCGEINEPAACSSQKVECVMGDVERLTEILRYYMEDTGGYITSKLKANLQLRGNIESVAEDVLRSTAADVYANYMAKKRAEKSKLAAKAALESSVLPNDRHSDVNTEGPEQPQAPAAGDQLLRRWTERPLVGERKERSIKSLWSDAPRTVEVFDVQYYGKKVYVVYDYDPSLERLARDTREKTVVKKGQKEPLDELAERVAAGVASGAITVSYCGTGDNSISMRRRSEDYKHLPLRYRSKGSGERLYYAVTPAAAVLGDYEPSVDYDVPCVVVVAECRTKPAETLILERIRGTNRRSMNSNTHGGIK